MRHGSAIGVAVLALLGGAAGGWLAGLTSLEEPRVQDDGEVASLRATVARLERQFAALDTVAAAFVPPTVVREAAPAPGRGAAGDGVAIGTEGGRGRDSDSTTGSLDPRRLLAEWVASFAAGGEGSEFFRMAVAAYAWPLRAELRLIALDRAAVEALRLQVIAMLDGGSFRGDADTIDALVDLLRLGGFEPGELAALSVLARIGGGRTAELLESLALALGPEKVRAAAFDAIVALAGGGAERILLRLLERARDAGTQRELLARFTGADPEATLRAFELASRFGDREPRLVAAESIGQQRGAPFAALAQEWHGREPDEEVRQMLAQAIAEQSTVPSYHPLQATGEPNVAVLGNDDGRAWASATSDGGAEWLEVVFDPPARADRVTITQTCVAGAITEVRVEQGGQWRSIWSGTGSPRELGAFAIDFRGGGAVSRVRVVMDTKLVPGWKEIDAVVLSGPDGRVTASAASASSWYGQGRTARGDMRIRLLRDDLSGFLEK
jgi:hypothetical protein